MYYFIQEHWPALLSSTSTTSDCDTENTLIGWGQRELSTCDLIKSFDLLAAEILPPARVFTEVAKQLGSFNNFPRLPSELRGLIWRFAWEEEQANIGMRCVGTGGRYYDELLWYDSALSHACTESREICLERITTPYAYPFDLGIDRFYILNDSLSYVPQFLDVLPSDVRHGIRNLVLPLREYLFHSYGTLEAVTNMRSLAAVEFVYGESKSDLRYLKDTLCWRSLDKEAEKAGYAISAYWQMRRQIAKQLGEQWSDQAPVVTFRGVHAVQGRRWRIDNFMWGDERRLLTCEQMMDWEA